MYKWHETRGHVSPANTCSQRFTHDKSSRAIHLWVRALYYIRTLLTSLLCALIQGCASLWAFLKIEGGFYEDEEWLSETGSLSSFFLTVCTHFSCSFLVCLFVCLFLLKLIIHKAWNVWKLVAPFHFIQNFHSTQVATNKSIWPQQVKH